MAANRIVGFLLGAALLVMVGGVEAQTRGITPANAVEEAVAGTERTVAALSAAVVAAYDDPANASQVIAHYGFVESPGWYLAQVWQVRLDSLGERLRGSLPARSSALRTSLDRFRERLSSDRFGPDVDARNEALVHLRLELLEDARVETAKLRVFVSGRSVAERLDAFERAQAVRLLRDVRLQVTLVQASVSTDASSMARGSEPRSVVRRPAQVLGSLGAFWHLGPELAAPLLSTTRDAASLLAGMGGSSAVVLARGAVDYVEAGLPGRLVWDPGQPSASNAHRAVLELRDALVPRALRALDAALETLAQAPVAEAAARSASVGLLGARVE